MAIHEIRVTDTHGDPLGDGVRREIEAFHPHRIRTEAARQAALTIFKNIVAYTKEY